MTTILPEKKTKQNASRMSRLLNVRKTKKQKDARTLRQSNVKTKELLNLLKTKKLLNVVKMLKKRSVEKTSKKPKELRMLLNQKE